jgi:hypothetical protein
MWPRDSDIRGQNAQRCEAPSRDRRAPIERGVHSGRIRLEGAAPDRLRFELPLGSWSSGDLRVD